MSHTCHLVLFMYEKDYAVRSYEEMFKNKKSCLSYVFHYFENGNDKTVILPLYIPTWTCALLGFKSLRFHIAQARLDLCVTLCLLSKNKNKNKNSTCFGNQLKISDFTFFFLDFNVDCNSSKQQCLLTVL